MAEKRVTVSRRQSTAVYICPGPADEMEDCTYWQTAPGWCPFHPHIDLESRPLTQTTIPPDHPGLTNAEFEGVSPEFLPRAGSRPDA